MNISGITRFFTPLKKTPLVPKPSETIATKGKAGEPQLEQQEYSSDKQAEASTHYMTYDRHGKIHEEGEEPNP